MLVGKMNKMAFLHWWPTSSAPHSSFSSRTFLEYIANSLENTLKITAWLQYLGWV
jgi:hypothetical protein